MDFGHSHSRTTMSETQKGVNRVWRKRADFGRVMHCCGRRWAVAGSDLLKILLLLGNGFWILCTNPSLALCGWLQSDTGVVLLKLVWPPGPKALVPVVRAMRWKPTITDWHWVGRLIRRPNTRSTCAVEWLLSSASGQCNFTEWWPYW